ncbi:MAG: cation-efflux pump [Ignavibacteria bacterium]|nr:cation-efflux pump [Ignavibacteria bacterium]
MTEIEIQNKKKLRIAINSFFAALFIVTIKFVAAYISGSIAVLSELFHSSIDLLACVATVISVKYSSKPPDSKHQYGHEKIESISALFQVLILIIMCGYLIYESIDRIIHPYHPEINIWIFTVIIVCIGIDYSRARALMKVARETNSQALEADSLHFSSDILSSIFVLISMVFTYYKIPPLYKDVPLADPIAAIIVSVIIFLTTLKLTKRAFNLLMDRAPDGLYEDIKELILSNGMIEGLKSLRVRVTGRKTFIDSEVLIGRTRMFSEAHEIVNEIENKIKEKYPHSDIVIHTEPVETKYETLNDKIRLIVNKNGFKCHDLYTYKINDKYYTDIHIEIDSNNDLNSAHKQITSLEEKIKNELKEIEYVHIHLDPPASIIDNVQDITKDSKNIITQIEKILISDYKDVHFHDLKIFDTPLGIRISFNIEFDEDIKFDLVHKTVKEIEVRLYNEFKNHVPPIANIIIHSEPKGHS